MSQRRLLITSKMIFLFILFFNHLIILEIESIPNNQDNLKSNEINNTLPFDFIGIYNDKNFTDYGFPGSGTKEDPYRIENYEINSKIYDNGIAVVNTTKHFIIQNCYLMAYWSAIIIENVAPGTAIIQNNRILLSGAGIGVVRSNNVTILSNTLGPDNDFGVLMYYSNYSLIWNNTCFRNIANGIRSECSSFNRIQSNNCSANHNTGIVLYIDSDDIVSNNICNDNIRGIVLDEDHSITITANDLSFNSDFGGWFVDSTHVLINKNLFSFNNEEGSRAENLDNSDFTYNYFANNTLYGLLLDSYSTNNRIHHNRFIGNNLAGTSQAKDNGENNIWFDKKAKEGNFWSDWNSKKPYFINGTAQAKDRYPLNSDLERIYVPFLVVILGLLSISSILKRKQELKPSLQT